MYCILYFDQLLIGKPHQFGFNNTMNSCQKRFSSKDNSLVQSMPHGVGLWPQRWDGRVKHMALIKQDS